MSFVKNENFADEVNLFQSIGIETFAEIGYSPTNLPIMHAIKNGHTATEILRTNQILSSLV